MDDATRAILLEHELALTKVLKVLKGINYMGQGAEGTEEASGHLQVARELLSQAERE